MKEFQVVESGNPHEDYMNICDIENNYPEIIEYFDVSIYAQLGGVMIFESKRQ